MPAPTREALAVAALTPEPSLDVLARAGIDDPAGSLEPAVRDGVVVVAEGTVRFTHPLLASTALARSDRRAAPRAARTTGRRGHVGGGAGPPHGAGGGGARRRGGPDGGRRGAARPEPGARRRPPLSCSSSPPHSPRPSRRPIGRRRFDSARSLFDAGESQVARRMLEEQIESLEPGPERARSLQLLGQVVGRFASYRQGLVSATAALSEAGEDMALRAAIELDIAYCNVCLGDLGGAAPHVAAAAELAELAGGGRDARRGSGRADHPRVPERQGARRSPARARPGAGRPGRRRAVGASPAVRARAAAAVDDAAGRGAVRRFAAAR